MLQRLGDVVGHAHARMQRGIGVLEHHLDMAAQRRISAAGKPGCSRREQDLAAGRLDQPDDAAAEVDLPQPDSPTRPSVSPGAQVERDVGDGVHLGDRPRDQHAAADRKPLDQVPRPTGCGIRAWSRCALRPAQAAKWQAAMVAASPAPHRRRRPADVLGLRAARMEAQPAGRCPAGWHALDLEHSRSLSPRPCCADRGQQAARVGMARARTRRRRSARLHDLGRHTSTATRSAVPATTPRSWVIRISAESEPLAQALQHLEDLRLHGHVERRRRLVGDQQSGSFATAMAIIARCRMPPENSCGILMDASSGCGMATRSSSSTARS